MFHTEKARTLKHQIEDAMWMESIDIENYKQGNMQHPSSPHRNVEEFWNDYHSKPFPFIIEKYARNNIFLNIRYILRRIRGAVK